MQIQVEREEYNLMPCGMRLYFYPGGESGVDDTVSLTPKFAGYMHFQIGKLQVVDP